MAHIATKNEKMELSASNSGLIRTETVESPATNIYQNNVVHGGRVHYGPHITYNVTHQSPNPHELVIASLKYKEINLRRNTISSNHPDTFTWAFDRNKLRPWDDLSNWLRQEHGIFWIQGKAGSGKSTLMRFLAQDVRTRSLLNDWAAPREPILIQFYFWLSGSKLQRDFQGFLCSMLRQLLQADTELTDAILPGIDSTEPKMDVNDWSIRELKTALITAVIASDRPICIFVDGLDEYDTEDDISNFIDLLHELSESNTVKLCLSSRPEIRFEHEFGKCRKLRLQDLTREDMQTFVHGRLAKVYCKIDIQYAKAPHAADLEEMIIQKADGVFLWVHYALASIQKGLTHNDNESTLVKRLEDLPSGMSALFSNMWARLNGDSHLYRGEANMIFACADTTQSLFDLMVTLDENLANEYITKIVPLPIADLSARIKGMQKKLYTRCAGLLEVQDPKDYREYAREDWYCYACDGNKDPLLNSQLIKPHPKASLQVGQQPLLNLLRGTVTYIHRSARDFLLDTAEGRLIKGEITVSNSEISCLAIKARLASLIEDLDTPETVLYWQLPNLLLNLQHSNASEQSEQDMLWNIERVGSAIVSRKHHKSPVYGWYHCVRSDSHLGYPYMSLTGFAAAMGNIGFLTKSFHDILERQRRSSSTRSGQKYQIRPYFLGHLFICAALRIDTEIWRDGLTDTSLSVRLKNFRVMRWLVEQGADLTSEYCYTIGESRGRLVITPYEVFATAVYRVLDTIPTALDKEVIDSIKTICEYNLPNIILPNQSFVGPSWSMTSYHNFANTQMNIVHEAQGVGYLHMRLPIRKLQSFLLTELAGLFPHENISVPPLCSDMQLEIEIICCCQQGHQPSSLNVEAAVRLTEVFESVHSARSERHKDPIAWEQATSKLHQLIREMENNSNCRNDLYDYESLNEYMASKHSLFDNQSDLLPIDPNCQPISRSKTHPWRYAPIPKGDAIYVGIQDRLELSRKKRPWGLTSREDTSRPASSSRATDRRVFMETPINT